MNKTAFELIKIASKLLAYEFNTEEELKAYLKLHPKADKKRHWVKKQEDKPQQQEINKSKRIAPGGNAMPWFNKDEEIVKSMQETPEHSKGDGPEEGANEAHHMQQIYFETYKDGSKGVFKPENNDPEELEDVRHTLDGNVPQGKREIVAYKLDRILGLNITPPVTTANRNGVEGSVQGFVPGERAAEDGGHYRTMPHSKKMDMQRLAAFDYIICNTDRHENNYMIDQKHVYAIDNGLTFPKNESQFRSEPWRQLGGACEWDGNEDGLGEGDNNPQFDQDLMDHLAGIKKNDFMKAFEGVKFKHHEPEQAWDRLQDLVKHGGGEAIPESEAKQPSIKPESVKPEKKEDLVKSLKFLKDKVKKEQGKDLTPDQLLILFKTLAKKGLIKDTISQEPAGLTNKYPYEGGVK